MLTVRCNSKNYTPGKIVCIGRNYSDHIKEMGGFDAPAEPAIFLKPNSAIAFCPKEISIPEELGLVHHEVELCFIAGKRGKNISVAEADSFVLGYAVGIDLTLRDMQAAAKKSSGPWALSKGFDGSAIFGEFVESGKISDPCNLRVSLSVNGAVRQDGNTRDMIFKPAEILSYVSRFMTIEEGDIFMCGTPAGVGEIKDEDNIAARVDALPLLEFKVIRK